MSVSVMSPFEGIQAYIFTANNLLDCFCKPRDNKGESVEVMKFLFAFFFFFIKRMQLSDTPAFLHSASAMKGSCDLRQFGAAWCACPLCSLVQVSVSKIPCSVKHSFFCRKKTKR